MLINELLVKLGFETDASPLERVNEKLEGISHKLSFLAAAEVVKGLFELSERFSGLGEQIEGAAISAGITAEAFQKMAYAASQSGVGQDELSGALAKLNRNLFDAKNGSDQAIKSFADAGIPAEKIQSFRNSSEAMDALSNSIRQIDDPIRRQAVAMELLGRGSFKMVKYLGQGADANHKLGASADDAGAVVRNQQIEALAELEDKLSSLKGVFTSLGAQVGAKLAPSIIFLVDKFKDFYAANQKVISQHFDDWIYSITYGLGYFAGVVQDVTGIVFAFIDAHPYLVKWVGRAAIALGALSLITEMALGSIGLFTGGIKNSINTFKLFNEVIGLFGDKQGTAFGYAIKGLLFFKSALGQVALRLAVMLAGVFPRLSGFLLSINTALLASPIGIFAAGLLLAILAGQALWTLLHGGSLKDTWFGILFDKVLALPSALMKIYRYLKGEKDPVESIRGDGSGSLLTRPSDGDNFAAQLGTSDLTSQMQALFGNAGNAFGAASSMTSPALTPSTSMFNMMDDAKMSGGYTLNAPVTINTSDVLGPEQAYKAVKEAAGDHFDRQVRDLMRSQQTAVVN